MSSIDAPDWASIPAPLDDGAADGLVGRMLPAVELAATDGRRITLASLAGRTVVYAYPRTGRPGAENPPGWDLIPGARGCTPQTCAFRDHYGELRALGVAHVFGLATQDTAYQREAEQRLHLPFPLLSDDRLAFARALGLPTFETAGMTLLKRLTLILDDGRITTTFYPVFPPDRNASDVVAWLRSERGSAPGGR